jgi:PAS domain S-box-containing protein
VRTDKTLVSGKAATLRAHAARFSVETPVATQAPIGDARRAFSYLVAALAALAATYARYVLSAIWGGTKLPFITFYPAVALAAWFGGLGPGLLATAISTVGALLLFAPLGSLRMEDPYDFVAVALFTSVNVFISALTGALHRTRRGTEVMRDATRQSEDRLRAIVISATDAIITIDANHRITLFNAAAEAMFGYSGDEVTGQTLDQLIPERFREIHRRHIEVFGATGVNLRAMGGERVLAGLRRSGEEFPMEARISQIEVAGQKLYTVILRDITGRKRAEAEREGLLIDAERARGEAESALQVVKRCSRSRRAPSRTCRSTSFSTS